MIIKPNSPAPISSVVRCPIRLAIVGAIVDSGIADKMGDHLIAVENTPEVHNMVVCTLCSCYPWDVLGLPPVWYKSMPYRSRAVIEPREVLKDFGIDTRWFDPADPAAFEAAICARARRPSC